MTESSPGESVADGESRSTDAALGSASTVDPGSPPTGQVTVPPQAGQPTPAGRMAFVDGLRGLSALAVTLYHLADHRECETLAEGWFAPLFALVNLGFLGVAVFYTLTGLVIAQSWGLRAYSWPTHGRFVARRLLRLTPPYWATLVLVVATTALANQVLPGYDHPLPSLGSLVAHAFYLHSLVGYPGMLAIFWTLVHIVEFYLLFPWLVAAVQRGSGLWARWESRPAAASPLAPGAVLLVVALPAWASAWWAPRIEGLLVDTWYIFCLGVVVGWMLRGWVSREVGAIFAAGIAASLPLTGSAFALASLATCLLIVLAWQRGSLDRWLAGPVSQFLGKISYSLYLLHGTVGWRVLSVGERLTGPDALSAALWLGVALAASILAAYVLYRLVEEPCQRLSRRLIIG